jgi:hypothetical protein
MKLCNASKTLYRGRICEARSAPTQDRVDSIDPVAIVSTINYLLTKVQAEDKDVDPLAWSSRELRERARTNGCATERYQP